MSLQVSVILFTGGGVPGPRGGLVRGGCLVPGGLVLGGVPGGDPPGRLLLRAVRILLECILVCFFFSKTCVFLSQIKPIWKEIVQGILLKFMTTEAICFL